MRFGLTRLLIGDHQFLEMTAEQFQRLVSARRNVIDLLHIEEKFVFLIENFRELEIDALSNTLQNATLASRPWTEMISDIHLFNRRIINLLTTCRVYLDHVPHHLSAIFPDDEVVKGELQQKLSVRYDASFSYRLLEALRNYVQHRGLPLSGLRRNSRIIDPGNRQSGTEHTLEFNIDSARLIEDTKFKRAVANELEAKTGRIDIRPMIREYVALLADVHQELRERLNATFTASENTVSDTIAQYSQGDVNLEIALYAVEEDQQQQLTHKFYLDRSPAKRYREILGRYSHLSSITRQYITSAPPSV